MVRIGGPTVVINFKTVTVQFNHALGTVVTVFTKRLQFAEHKLIPILVVLLNMIGNGRWCNNAVRKTHATQRLSFQLQQATALPEVRAMRMV
jgi:hypothetical protein